jgi:hypothetical protein
MEATAAIEHDRRPAAYDLTEPSKRVDASLVQAARVGREAAKQWVRDPVGRRGFNLPP